jgi:TonB family protein
MNRQKCLCFLLCALSTAAFVQVHPTAVRVLEDYMRPLREKRVDPAYPQAALKTGIHDVVELHIRISQKGDIQDVQLISGHPVPAGTTTPPLAHPVKISRRLGDSLVLKKASPEYSAEARTKHVEGDVMLRVIIDQDGDVYSATPTSGDPLLTQAAVDAVKKWKYKPYQVAGRAVDADTTVIVSFTLAP